MKREILSLLLGTLKFGLKKINKKAWLKGQAFLLYVYLTNWSKKDRICKKYKGKT